MGVQINPGTNVANVVMTPVPPLARFLKYLTAYGVNTWRPDLLAPLVHFDMVAIDLPGFGGADITPVRAMYPSHSQLKLLAYLDTCVHVQGTGHTDFNPSSPNYWGYFIESKFKEWQASYGGALDGLFLDNTYDNSCGDYDACRAGNGGAPYATYSDYRTLGSWLTGKLGHARQVPIVLENGGDVELANRADLWMAEDFPVSRDRHQIDYLAQVTSAGKGAVTLYRDASTDDEAHCRWNLCCFLCGWSPNGTGYFEFQDIWKTSQGYYPMMDVDYGTPLGPYSLSGTMLTRQYSKCTVSVDPGNLTSGQIVMK
jgi:hypothetical protein